MRRQRPTLDYETPARGAFGPRDAAVVLLISLSGLLPLAIGLSWLHAFIFTDYRAHFRPIMIPLGLIATLMGMTMTFGPWAIRWLVRQGE